MAELPLEKQERIKQALASYHADLKARWLAEHPFVEPARVKHLLARHLGFSEIEQFQYLWRFLLALSERGKESHPVSWKQWRGQFDSFDPFLDADDVL
jgi:hypothetical protein